MSFRSASHAGDWYSNNPRTLSRQLSQWLSAASSPKLKCKAVIAPHAGYAYSGSNAAYAYSSIDTTGIKRVFVLGPSHHVYLDGCALSGCKEYETPIGSLPLDLDTISALKETNLFTTFTLEQDEDEHSLEMHLPYIRAIFSDADIKIVPIVVGAISQIQEQKYGNILAKYLKEDDTLFVTSSDFCHWGTRFQYTFYYPSAEAPGIRLTRPSTISNSYPIHESIKRLDEEAIDILTLPDGGALVAHNAFAAYLKSTGNTICGRHPIGVLLGALAAIESEIVDSDQKKATIHFVKYDRSSLCETLRDSSVSYASAVITM